MKIGRCVFSVCFCMVSNAWDSCWGFDELQASLVPLLNFEITCTTCLHQIPVIEKIFWLAIPGVSRVLLHLYLEASDSRWQSSNQRFIFFHFIYLLPSKVLLFHLYWSFFVLILCCSLLLASRMAGPSHSFPTCSINLVHRLVVFSLCFCLP